MAWLRVDDRAMLHPKVIALRTMRDDVATPVAVVGFVMLAASWSGQHMTDCEIPLGVGEAIDGGRWEVLAAAAVKVGMLSKPRRLTDGQRGWVVCIDDGLLHLMSRAERDKNRHRRISRQDQNRVDLHLRDSDLCRYCGQTVNPADGVGGRGREFDHPDPTDDTVTVIACRRCNLKKAGRTPDESEMPLRPPPDPKDRHFHPTTLTWLANRGIDPERPAAPIADPAYAARPGSPLGAAAAAPERPAHPAAAAPSTPDLPSPPEVPPEGVADHRHPGRDGPGRDGSPVGLEGDTSPPAATARRRGRRAGRGRSRPASPTQQEQDLVELEVQTQQTLARTTPIEQPSPLARTGTTGDAAPHSPGAPS